VNFACELEVRSMGSDQVFPGPRFPAIESVAGGSRGAFHLLVRPEFPGMVVMGAVGSAVDTLELWLSFGARRDDMQSRGPIALDS
jgi:hypothetical protein